VIEAGSLEATKELVKLDLSVVGGAANR